MKLKIFPITLIGIIAALGSASVLAANINNASPSILIKAQKKNRIGMKKAREIALTKAAGKIEGSELENENGKTIYSFDIRNNKGTITEVQVEAYTGEIVSIKEENAREEAAEKQQDAKKTRKKTN